MIYNLLLTLSHSPPASPLSNVAITRRGSGSVEVSWTPLSLIEARGFPKYVVSYISDDSSITGTVESTNSSVVISGLHRVIITDPKNNNKMADAIDAEKQIAFIKRRNNP